MHDENPPKPQQLQQAVDSFWEAFPPSGTACAHIRQVATEQFDIGVEQFHILRHIRRGHDTVSDLAEAKNISRPAASQAVELLVTRGLVARTRDSDDRRHVRLALTGAGALLDAVFEDTGRWMMARFSALSDEELHALMQAMQALHRIGAE
ncbi:MAG: MarR family transcriptional regulator [Anaerolineae bacterium]|nr:MAG: MarR family transcriptional regulator [Anaerolineae bacterium]